MLRVAPVMTKPRSTAIKDIDKNLIAIGIGRSMFSNQTRWNLDLDREACRGREKGKSDFPPRLVHPTKIQLLADSTNVFLAAFHGHQRATACFCLFNYSYDIMELLCEDRLASRCHWLSTLEPLQQLICCPFMKLHQ